MPSNIVRTCTYERHVCIVRMGRGTIALVGMSHLSVMSMEQGMVECDLQLWTL